LLLIVSSYIPKQKVSSKVVFVNAYTHLSFFVQGLTLDERGRFSGEAEKRLEEVRILFSIYFFMNYFTRK